MKPDDIEDLLTRYYEGVTSEAEEKELKRFFICLLYTSPSPRD